MAKSYDEEAKYNPRFANSATPSFSLLFVSGSNKSVSTDNLRLQKRVFRRLLKKKTCRATDHLDNLGMLMQSSVYSF